MARVSENIKKVFDHNNERIEKLRNKLIEVGVCPDCLQTCCHSITEPFADCNCGTGEDYLTRPLQLLQHVRYCLVTGEEIGEEVKEKIKKLEF